VARPSETRLLVLHGLRLKGFTEADVVGALFDLSEDEVDAQLEGLRDESFVLRRDGRLSGWSLTSTGRAAHEQALADELDASGLRSTVHDAYGRFLALNKELLGVCTRWQMRDEQTLNDHTDASYDRAVIDELGSLHAELDGVLVPLEESFERYRGYRGRFDHAVAALQAGETDYFTKPIMDSYHTIWFELHEDLLDTLGLERSKEEC
jgi:hypothetical protein